VIAQPPAPPLSLCRWPLRLEFTSLPKKKDFPIESHSTSYIAMSVDLVFQSWYKGDDTSKQSLANETLHSSLLCQIKRI
jgi:hypothetical protein